MVNGYYLNNELTDFSFVPAQGRLPGREPRRRRQAAAQLDEPDDRLRARRTGGARCRRSGRVDHSSAGHQDAHWRARLPTDPAQAIALPMIYAPGDTVLVESGTFLEAMIPQLQALGHPDVRTVPPGTFKANAIERVERRAGSAAPIPEAKATVLNRANRRTRPRQLERFANLVSMFLTRAAEKGERPFLWSKREGEWCSISWADAARQVASPCRVAEADRPGAGRPRRTRQREPPEWLISDLAIMAAGCVTVPTYTTNTDTRSFAHPGKLRRSGGHRVKPEARQEPGACGSDLERMPSRYRDRSAALSAGAGLGQLS